MNSHTPRTASAVSHIIVRSVIAVTIAALVLMTYSSVTFEISVRKRQNSLINDVIQTADGAVSTMRRIRSTF